MVIPVGSDESSQLLVRLIREDETQFREEDLASVRFVPLIGEQGWLADTSQAQRSDWSPACQDAGLSHGRQSNMR